MDYNASTNDSWIPGDFVEEAMKLGPADVVPIGGWVIGIDAAHMGDDESVIHLRRGRLNLEANYTTKARRHTVGWLSDRVMRPIRVTGREWAD